MSPSHSCTIIFIAVCLRFHTATSQGMSFYTPTFSSCAMWNTSATTWLSSSITNVTLHSIFIHKNGSTYMLSSTYNIILLFPNHSRIWFPYISNGIAAPESFFVDNFENVYIGNRENSPGIDLWTKNASTPIRIMNTIEACAGLFVDLNNTLYCTLPGRNRILLKSLNTNSTYTNFLGTGCAGLSPDKLVFPWGIFVHDNFSLYVADSGNNRIQHFLPNQKNATTVAGYGAPNTIVLNTPRGIMLDGDGFLFITDTNNNRIIASGANGFRCVAGCSESSTPWSQRLYLPLMFHFDRFGNIFVSDRGTNRIQIFYLMTNSCNPTSSESPLSTSYVSTESSNSIINETGTIPVSTTETITTLKPQSPIPTYNQPKLSRCSTWNPNGTTILNSRIMAIYGQTFFIDKNNTLYSIFYTTKRIWIIPEGSSTSILNVSNGTETLWAVFLSHTGDLYASSSGLNVGINRWSSNWTQYRVVLRTGTECRGIFVDLDNYVYCSASPQHKVYKKYVDDEENTMETVAGTGCSGLSNTLLNYPYGIFVDLKFNLYVADFSNNRIQMFVRGNRSGITIAGVSGIYQISIIRPSSVVLDLDDNLFITDAYNHRIVMAGPMGIRCIVGCGTINGSASFELSYPSMMMFDSYGNVIVSDTYNNRIQKYDLITSSCADSTTERSSANTESTSYSTVVLSVTSASSISTSQPNMNCNSSHMIGINCNISNAPCDVNRWCLNNGTCVNDLSVPHGYKCLCSAGFIGTYCQMDSRSCRAGYCRNNGICINVSVTNVYCLCPTGWTGEVCQKRVDYCKNVECQNDGVCKSTAYAFECRCLSTSYSGRFCEFIENALSIKKIVGKSLMCVAIAFILTVFIYVLVLDVLKYIFGIDIAPYPKQKIRKRNHPTVGTHFVYIK